MGQSKRNGLFLIVVSVAFSVGLGLHGGACAGVGRRQVVAEIAKLEGTVAVLPAGHELWQEAAAGQAVRHGDRVRAGASSWAAITLAAGGSVTLGPGCEVLFDSLLRLRLFIGRIWAKVRPALGGAENFRVVTPTAVVGVRGTTFSVCVNADRATMVSVLSGLVEVASADGTVLVPAGYATRVKRGLAPVPPKPMDDEEERAWDENERWAGQEWDEDYRGSGDGNRGDHGAANQDPPAENGPPGDD